MVLCGSGLRSQISSDLPATIWYTQGEPGSAVLPDKLEGDHAGNLDTSSQNLATLGGASPQSPPVEHTQELCDTLQDALIDTLRHHHP